MGGGGGVKKWGILVLKTSLTTVCHKGTDRKKSYGLKCWGDFNSLYKVSVGQNVCACFRNFFLTVYIHTMGRVVHGASCPWGEMSVGRNVRGASCPWGELSVGRDVRGARCPWGEMSVGRNVRGASCPWGEMSVGRNVVGRVVVGRAVLGRVVLGRVVLGQVVREPGLVYIETTLVQGTVIQLQG